MTRSAGQVLLLAAACCAAAIAVHAQSTITVTVDVSANRRAINSNIYGVANATSAQLTDLNAPLHRLGGNPASSYNWSINAANRGSDWYFESVGESSATAGQLGDDFITSSRSGGAQAMVTIPMLDWVAKLGSGRSKLASFSSTKYGTQDDCDWAFFSTACNGLHGGVPITGNDPNDASTPNTDTNGGDWAAHIVGKFGLAASGGLRYYVLDNEYSIWHATHRDVHPAGAGMDEILDKMRRYALRIKGVDPGAQIVGPEEWGWSGYLLSGADQQYGGAHGWSNLPDKTAHGNMDYVPWLLQQLKAASQANNVHLLDMFSLHYYPQGGEFGDDVSASMQARRNRSTRSLWDPSYVDETWIADTVKLIPRMRSWADTYYYAGTPIAITEYNWGAEGNINGGTAQADVLGIFGREGLDAAARWGTPATGSPTYNAMKLYRNYDGAKSGFGETSVKVTSSGNPDSLAVFAAQRSGSSAVTVMVINKVGSSATVAVTLANTTPGATAQVWRVAGTSPIAHLADVAVAPTGVAFTGSVPAQSITLYVIPATGGTTPPPTVPKPPTGLHIIPAG